MDIANDNYESIKQQFANVPRSAHNFSKMSQFTANFGNIIPIDCMRTLPNEDYNLAYKIYLATRNPTTRKLLTNVKYYVHAYYNRCSDLYEGWNNFVTKGRTGNIVKTIPTINTMTQVGTQASCHFNTPMSLSDYLGIPLGYIPFTASGESPKPINYGFGAYETSNNKPTKICGDLTVNALPFFMYQKIYRDYYLTSNLTQNNKMWFPDNEDHFIIPYACTSLQYLDYDRAESGSCNFDTAHSDDWNNSWSDNIPENSNEFSGRNSVHLLRLRSREFRSNVFESSSPFPNLVRGNMPTLADFTSDFDSYEFENACDTSFGFDSSGFEIGAIDNPGDAPEGYKTLKNAILSRVDMNSFRALSAYTQFVELNGRVKDGSYNDLINVQFGYNPNVYDRKPQYIGGYFGSLNFSEVVQTSGSTGSGSINDALGASSSRAVDVNDGYIGKFHSPDFGYIMVVLEIVPDSFYNSPLEKIWTDINQSDIYFPVLNNLSPRAILKKELSYEGNSSDDTLFSYSERYSEYKSRVNTLAGLTRLGSYKNSSGHSYSLYDASNVMVRPTGSAKLSNEWLACTPDSIDMTAFYSQYEPPFDVSVGCIVDKVSPIPSSNVQNYL